MADPLYNFIATTGVIMPDTSDLLTNVQSEWQTAFGLDLVVTSDTPQGVMIVAEVSARSSVVANNAQMGNQLNPNYAGGVFLDAICALMGLEREAATRTQVPGVIFGGQPSTIIPTGSLVRCANGNFFTSVNTVTLDPTGFATVQCQAVLFGAIPCASGDLTKPGTQLLGWETVSNPFGGVLGVNEQSDASLRALRNVTLARQGISTVEAQVSDLEALPGVASLSYRENVTATDMTIDGIFLKAHSIWACVDGGADLDIATSLLNNKTDGAGWNGAQSVDVTSPFSEQTYTVLFDRTTQLAVFVTVAARRGTDTSDLTTTIPQAVVDYSNGLVPNEQGFVSGGDISPFAIASGINYFLPGIQISKVQVFLAGGTPAPVEIPMALNQRGITSTGSVSVTLL